jgi:signal transduction histidine kinase
MNRMTLSRDLSVPRYLGRLRANWPALLLPLVTAGMLLAIHALTLVGPGVIHGLEPVSLIVGTGLLALLLPEIAAGIAPFALFAYSAVGIWLMHSLLVYETNSAWYGFVRASRGAYPHWHTSSGMWLVLTQAMTVLAAGVWLLARDGAPGGSLVRLMVAQLRGTDGHPKTVPPLLLVPVTFLGEEVFGQHLWFGSQGGDGSAFWPLVIGALIIAASAAAAVVFPRTAAITAVTGLVLFGLCGLVPAHVVTDNPAVPFYGGFLLDGGVSSALAEVQGAALLVAGCTLIPRLLTWEADNELAERARALARRVDGLTRTRSDATETAVAELRRIERDLHDGAQARLVAVGMSLRAVEQLIGTNPDAALALVAEARETSSRALADLRDLVRGIYPPVLADRGLAEAVRNLALDTVLDAQVEVDLPAEPPMPVAAAVYFALAEALANAARHAAASTVLVGLEHAGGMLRATVTDDGSGGADPARGTGLAGVERRLATFDGILAVSSPVGGPTIVAIEVPCALSSVKISSC